MIKLISRSINCILNRLFPDDKEISFSEAIKLEHIYYETPSIASMKNYRNPHVGQKFLCQEEGEMYVYVGGKKFVCMTNVYV